MTTRSGTVSLIALALLITALNAIKPLHMDDGAFYDNAAQIAKHPLNPYGFTSFWSQWPEPGNWAVCPPVLPYWWAIAIRIFGDAPVLWKLWLFPWIAIFVFALHALFRRFAPGMAMPLVWMTALSPTFLPAVNLMLDVPAIALGLAAFSAAMGGIDRGSIASVIWAGLVAGVAMETKYTAAIFPALIFIYGLLHRRWMLALIPGLVAALFFSGCEMLIAHRYGWSHFLFHMQWTDTIKGSQPKSWLLPGLFTLIGGLAPGVGIFGLAALGASRRILWITSAVVIAGYLVLLRWPVAPVVFFLTGAGIWAISLVAAPDMEKANDDLMIWAWLILEIIGYVFISPFTAARRAIGLVLVITVIVGRLASQKKMTTRDRRTIGAIVAGSIVLGLAFYMVDFADALAQKRAVTRAASVIEAAGKPAPVWFAGHWGFQFYARELGMRSVIPDNTLLRKGDWLLYPHAGVNLQRVSIPAALVNEVATVRVDDPVKVQCAGYYYGTGLPMQWRFWPRVWLSVYRVKEDFIPKSSFTAREIVKWAATRGRPLPPASAPAVFRSANEVGGAAGETALEAIRSSGEPAISALLNDPDPRAHDWAEKALAKNRGSSP